MYKRQLVNDSDRDVEGTVTVSIYHLGEERNLRENQVDIRIGQGGSDMVFDLAEYRFFPKDCLLSVSYTHLGSLLYDVMPADYADAITEVISTSPEGYNSSASVWYDSTWFGTDVYKRQALRNGFTELFKQTGVCWEQVKMVIGCGMLTSELGLVQIPHISCLLYTSRCV